MPFSNLSVISLARFDTPITVEEPTTYLVDDDTQLLLGLDVTVDGEIKIDGYLVESD